MALLAPLFEEAPRFMGRLAAGRPFGGWDALFVAALRVAQDMPLEEQIELIDAHPRIGAPPGSVSALSFVEQGYGQESAEPGTEPAGSRAEAERRRIQAELDRLNAAYEAAFGFRFVVFVAGRPRAEIVPLMEAALLADKGVERDRALRDVVAIARDRAIKGGLMSDDIGRDGSHQG